MIKKGLIPGIKIGIDLPDDEINFRRVMPFRRSWVAIALLAAMDIAFIIPAVLTFNQAIAEWGRFDSLFDLVAAIFLSAWLLGWAIAPLIMSSILVVMLFGREVLKAKPGSIEIFFGIPVFGITAHYDVSKMRNLRFETPLKKSGKSWRGSHLAFDYGANTVAVGSAIQADEVEDLRVELQNASGEKIRHGDVLPGELDEIRAAKQTVPAEPAPAKLTANTGPVTLSSPSSLVLIIANLVPIAGSLFWDWDLAHVMVLYWAESAVIGIFNVCKIIVIGRWMALLAGPFFLGHFGGFMAIHFLFLYTIFVKQPQTGGASTGNLADVAELFVILWPALAALFISHAFSYYRNFLGRQEYKDRTVNKQMSEPYSRIIFMHVVLIFGGGLTMILGSPTPVLLIVLALKIIFDVRAHLKQHTGG
jgi:hypothetical protein